MYEFLNFEFFYLNLNLDLIEEIERRLGLGAVDMATDCTMILKSEY